MPWNFRFCARGNKLNFEAFLRRSKDERQNCFFAKCFATRQNSSKTLSKKYFCSNFDFVKKRFRPIFLLKISPNSCNFVLKFVAQNKEKCPIKTNLKIKNSVTRKKSPKVYNSYPKMISLEKLKILTPLQKLPKNVGDLGKLIVADGF